MESFATHRRDLKVNQEKINKNIHTKLMVTQSAEEVGSMSTIICLNLSFFFSVMPTEEVNDLEKEETEKRAGKNSIPSVPKQN